MRGGGAVERSLVPPADQNPEKDKEKFAFTWDGIQYTFNRLPQGYKHSPTIAHAALAELLQTASLPQNVKLYQYIDDILIGGDSSEEVGEAATAVRQALHKAEIEIPPEKCQGPSTEEKVNLYRWRQQQHLPNPTLFFLLVEISIILLVQTQDPWDHALLNSTGSLGPLPTDETNLNPALLVIRGNEAYPKDNITVETSNRSNICVCNFTKIVGCDFNYSAPVTTHQLLQSSHASYQDLLPTPIGMDLTLVRKLLQDDDLSQLLNRIRNSGQRTLITFHHDAERIHHVLEKVKKDGEHHWWDVLFGWSPTATGTLNWVLHPMTILLVSVVLCLLLNIILCVKVWKIIKQMALIPKPPRIYNIA
ncbi:uncharacterized protein LOC142074382 [Calonectris borealis]|uniref:uncharacterized protein LOC142074382 n=1 Tax=Calonectris borealis TaxID=1323832 RepID=UPI003F4C2812